MLVNQKQPSKPEDTFRPSLEEESKLCHEWVGEGNTQDLGAGTDGSREPPPTGDPIDYSPMESGWKMYSPRNPWRDADLVHCSTLNPVNNILGWEALTQEFSIKKIAVAE